MECTDRPEYKAHLKGIIAHPDDDVRRLVLADWLEEHGEPERAEFIRVQVELSRVPGYPRAWDGDMYPHVAVLHRRQVWLLNMWDYRRGWRHLAGRYLVKMLREGQPWYDLFQFRRGFVESVRCTLADWCGGSCSTCGGQGSHGGTVWVGLDGKVGSEMDLCPTGHVTGHGPAIVRKHPVTQVNVTDREPLQSVFSNTPDDERYGWVEAVNGNMSSLPPAIFRRLSKAVAGSDWAGYPTPEAAVEDLSAACVRFGLETAHTE